MDASGSAGAAPSGAAANRARGSRVRELLRRVAKVTAPLARPLAGRRWMPIWAVVHHIGRQSGRAYSVPVAIAATDTHMYIPVPFGPGTQWVQNVMAAAGCTVVWKGRDVTASEPSLIGQDEASAAFNRLERPLIRAAGLEMFLRLSR
jgi:deazaflavin-dependent oxidoreductase (nitroreductase family)